MHHLWLLQGLYVRVLIALIAGITIVLAVVTALTIQNSQARLEDQLLTQGRRQAESLVAMVSPFVNRAASDDRSYLIAASAGAVASEGVQYVAIYSAEGKLIQEAAANSSASAAHARFSELLAQSQLGSTSAERWTDGYLEIIQPILNRDGRIGSVAIRSATEELQAERSRTLIQGLVTGLGLIVALSLIIGVLLRQLMIVPLRRLSKDAETISTGIWVTPQGQSRRDELGQVARSFGEMVQALQSRESQLQEQVKTIQAMNSELDARVAARTADLHQLVTSQEQLLSQIRQMSTPVVPVLEGVVVIPLVGSLDSRRAAQLIQQVLAGIEAHRANLVVLDITGVPVVDSHVASTIIQAANAARLLGTTTALVGIRPEVAQTLVQFNIDLRTIHTFATLQEALRSTITSARQASRA